MRSHVGVAVAVPAPVALASWENEGGPPPVPAENGERLDWTVFLARFYPDARKHDYVPLAAYVEYREQRRRGAEVTRPARGRTSSATHVIRERRTGPFGRKTVPSDSVFEERMSDTAVTRLGSVRIAMGGRRR